MMLIRSESGQLMLVSQQALAQAQQAPRGVGGQAPKILVPQVFGVLLIWLYAPRGRWNPWLNDWRFPCCSFYGCPVLFVCKSQEYLEDMCTVKMSGRHECKLQLDWLNSVNSHYSLILTRTNDILTCVVFTSCQVCYSGICSSWK